MKVFLIRIIEFIHLILTIFSSVGRYYLYDKGYPDRKGYMVPYSKVKYHQSQFERQAPQNVREAFNHVHSSLRTTIERCFGV